jgi:hypothetical protein
MLESTNRNQFVYKDYLQEFFDTSSKPFVKEIVLIVALYWFYTTTPLEDFIIFIKYIIILILIRYVLSVLTQIRDNNDKRYFVLNANVIIFTTIILWMNQSGSLVDSGYLASVLITSYSLLVISTKEHYTSDVLVTLLVTYSLFNNSTVKYYVNGLS